MNIGLDATAPLLAAFLAALATGFLGSLHCIGMCGTTIASVMQRRIQAAGTTTLPSAAMAIHVPIFTVPMHAPGAAMGISTLMRASLAFNAGRIASYILAGALVAGVASGIAARVVVDDLTPLRLMLFVFGQCLVIATGFYIAGMTAILAPFERAGQWLWTRLQRWIAPRLQMYLRDGQAQPFAFGALWGWIPCGLVYGTLATAMASGGATSGALIMLGFGLGTLPAMFAAGTAAAPLRRLATMPRVRIAAGSLVVLLGLLGLSRVTQMPDVAALARLCLGTA